MLLYSLDCETTGLDPNFCQLLEVGIIEWDTKVALIFENLRKLKLRIIQDKIIGQPFALQMNSHILLDLYKYLQIKSTEDRDNFSKNLGVVYCNEDEIQSILYKFITDKYPTEKDEKVHINVCGKNFASFDFQFLKKLQTWGNLIRIRHRIPDPSILYVDWENDDVLPSTDICKQRIGDMNPVSHDSLEDAFDVINLIYNHIKIQEQTKKVIDMTKDTISESLPILENILESGRIK